MVIDVMVTSIFACITIPNLVFKGFIKFLYNASFQFKRSNTKTKTDVFVKEEKLQSLNTCYFLQYMAFHELHSLNEMAPISSKSHLFKR